MLNIYISAQLFCTIVLSMALVEHGDESMYSAKSPADEIQANFAVDEGAMLSAGACGMAPWKLGELPEPSWAGKPVVKEADSHAAKIPTGLAAWLQATPLEAPAPEEAKGLESSSDADVSCGDLFSTTNIFVALAGILVAICGADDRWHWVAF